MIEGDDARRIRNICYEALDYITAIANNCDNLHWSYLAEKTEKAQTCVDILKGYYEEYRDKERTA